MDKLVWIDKEGSHVMVGNPERLEEKRKELGMDKPDEIEKIGKIRQNDTPSVAISILSILVYVVYMVIV